MVAIAHKWMWIAWPSFLVASLLEMVVFAMVDPGTLYWLDQPIQLSAEGVYTISFFVFWGLVSLSSILTAVLSNAPWELEERPPMRSCTDQLLLTVKPPHD